MDIKEDSTMLLLNSHYIELEEIKNKYLVGHWGTEEFEVRAAWAGRAIW